MPKESIVERLRDGSEKPGEGLRQAQCDSAAQVCAGLAATARTVDE